jgi:steroid 5-alpha reductase family enzyme
MKQLLIIFAIAIAMAWAGSQGGAVVAGLPAFAWCALLAFAIQALAFIPAYIFQTEKFYDLTGSITYLLVVVLALTMSETAAARSLLLALMIAVWAIRLGSFLFRRISQDGSDSRFDKIKPSPLRFFVTWNIQGLWVLMTAACALAAITAQSVPAFSPFDLLGISLWLLGFGIEVIADRQKRQFRSVHGGEAFISSGLWSRSRHPNYFGEILLWLGVALLALPALEGWRYVTLVSPLFVFFLLTRVSGVPLLERKSDRKWGDDPAYQAYKAATPVLVPRLTGGG